MYITENEEKPVIEVRFIMLRNLNFNYMTATGKAVYVDKITDNVFISQ